MMSGSVGAYGCIKAFSETDFTEDLGKMKVPTLLLQGDDDQVVPLGGSARKAVGILPQGRLKVYLGGFACVA